MSGISSSDSMLNDVKVGSVARHLVRTGWHRIEGSKNILAYRRPSTRPGDEEIVLTLPNDETYADARLRIAEAIEVLAAVERRRPLEIVELLHQGARDVFRLRIIQDELSLEDASQRVAGIRNLVSSAACAETDPKPYLVKSPQAGRDFAERCRFGQTFRGSFGFTVEAPGLLATDGGQIAIDGVEPPAPFERRVFLRIVRGLIAAREAVQSGSVNVIADQYAQGMNANMLDAIIEVAGEKKAPVEFDFAWSHEWAVPKDVEQRARRLRLTTSEYEYVESGARALKGPDIEEQARVTGRIIELKSADLVETRVTISDGARNIRVALPIAEYKRAVEAHVNQRSISFKGQLVKQGRTWELRRATDLEVHEQE